MALIIYIWYEHFQFFIRYGFRNARIVLMNSILLFFTLFYVFPLKFLVRILVRMYSNLLLGDAGMFQGINNSIPMGDMDLLMIIYGIGACIIFSMLMLMFRYALKKKEELELNDIEIFDTKSSMYTHVIMASVPAISVLLSLIFGRFWFSSMLSGFFYMTYPIIFAIYGSKRNKLRKKLLAHKK